MQLMSFYCSSYYYSQRQSYCYYRAISRYFTLTQLNSSAQKITRSSYSDRDSRFRFFFINNYQSFVFLIGIFSYSMHCKPVRTKPFTITILRTTFLSSCPSISRFWGAEIVKCLVRSLQIIFHLYFNSFGVLAFRPVLRVVNYLEAFSSFLFSRASDSPPTLFLVVVRIFVIHLFLLLLHLPLPLLLLFLLLFLLLLQFLLSCVRQKLAFLLARSQIVNRLSTEMVSHDRCKSV